MNLVLGGYLYEAVNRQIVFYHRTNLVRNIDSIGVNGILPELNDSALYGKGLYGTTTLESQFGMINRNDRAHMERLYGKYITKLRTVTDKLLILNPRLDPDLTLGDVYKKLTSTIPEKRLIEGKVLSRLCGMVSNSGVGDYIDEMSEYAGIDLIQGADSPFNELGIQSEISAIKAKNQGRGDARDEILLLAAKTFIAKNSGFKLAELIRHSDKGYVDGLSKINAFIQNLKKSKLLGFFDGFCIYGTSDGDVIVLHRGAVVTPIAYSNASPKSIHEVNWSPVSKKVKKQTKEMLNHTINSDGDRTYSFEDMVVAYNEANITKLVDVVDKNPNYLDKDYANKSWFQHAVGDGESDIGIVILDLLKKHNKIHETEVYRLFNAVSSVNIAQLPNKLAKYIMDFTNADGAPILDFKKVAVSLHVLELLIFAKKQNNDDILDILLEKGCPITSQNPYGYDQSDVMFKLLSSGLVYEANLAMENNKPNYHQAGEVLRYLSSISATSKGLSIKDFPALTDPRYVAELPHVPLYLQELLSKNKIRVKEILSVIKNILPLNADVVASNAYAVLIVKLAENNMVRDEISALGELISMCKSPDLGELVANSFKQLVRYAQIMFIEKLGSDFKINILNVDYPPLVYAILSNNLMLAENLLEIPEIDINGEASNGLNVLGAAIRIGDDEIIQSILSKPNIRKVARLSGNVSSTTKERAEKLGIPVEIVN